MEAKTGFDASSSSQLLVVENADGQKAATCGQAMREHTTV